MPYDTSTAVARTGRPLDPAAMTERRTILIHCAKCRAHLYDDKKGGDGGLVKCFAERIVKDSTAGDLRCPQCGREFARARELTGRPIHKIIQGKVFTRGMRRK